MLLLGYVVFVFLNIVDLHLTNVILKSGGKEFNFIARYFYKKFGIKGILGLKLVILSLIGFQCLVFGLDLFTIYYLNFIFIVVLFFMYLDGKKAGLKDQMLKFDKSIYRF